MSTLIENLKNVRACIHAHKNEHNAAQTVTLLAVSKKKPSSAIKEAFDAGQTAFGENYLQEALDKIETLKKLPIEWHFIGNMQSNKTREISTHFDWAHTVDRLKIAKRLSDQRPSHLPPLNICIQVNIDNEPSKAGIPEGDILALAKDINALPNITLRGLMAIPKPIDTNEANNNDHAFARMQQHLSALQAQLGGKNSSDKNIGESNIDTLSMGMSNDMGLAIQHGATIVRIGTAIFGERT